MIIFRKEHSNSYIYSDMFQQYIPLMEEILHQLRLVVSPNFSQGFIHPRWLFLISEPLTAAILIFRRRTYLMYSGFYSRQHSVGSRHRWYQAAGSKYCFPRVSFFRAKATTLAASHEPSSLPALSAAVCRSSNGCFCGQGFCALQHCC